MKTKITDSHKHEKGVKGLKKDGFYIVDWVGNEKFGGKTFNTFDSAWGFLYERFDKDEDLGEFYVICFACEKFLKGDSR